jgi:hypothetical protein
MLERWLQLMICVLVMTACGCGGSGTYQTRGRVLKGGAALTVVEPDFVRVVLVPLPEDGRKVLDWYVAEFNGSDGTFIVKGKDGKGMPPGKYRVSLELMKGRRDAFKGAFDAERSPLVVSVQSGSDEITVDVDKVELGKK